MKAKIIEGACMTLNQTTVDLWHADFDGDGMVFELCDDDYAVAEIRHLMRLPRQIVNEQTGSNPVHLVQDGAFGLNALSDPNVRLTQDEVLRFIGDVIFPIHGDPRLLDL